MKKNRHQEDEIYLHIHHLFRGQEQLLSDSVRNRAFSSALAKSIKPGSRVLDIGSGTGIWAITAALQGADKVVAIEQDALLIPMIKNLIKENGVAGKIDVIQGRSTELELDGQFDLIVSETIGNQAFEEQIVAIMVDAKKRFLKPGGALLPAAVSLVIAPAHFKNPLQRTPAGSAIKCGYFQLLNLNIPVMLSNKSRLKILAKPKTLLRVDLRSADRAPDLSRLTARWQPFDARRVNCFAVWAEMVLARGINLSTLDTTSWSPVIYFVKPSKQARGNLEFTLNMTEKSHYWTTVLTHKQELETQSYSPVFAYTSLITQIRLAEAFAKAAKRQ